MSANEYAVDAGGQRFAFGRNWQSFAAGLDPARLASARSSLAALLGRDSLAGARFLDLGCGSGIVSLAASELGARVHSFDYDQECVACTQQVRQTYGVPGREWCIERGSALDGEYLRALGTFDVVYSWGVLHHTGALWTAIANAAQCVAPGGQLAISIYNDQGWLSRYWTVVKRLYNRHAAGRWLMIAAHLPHLAARMASRLLRGKPLERGMSLWHDYIDWLGGYPFEVAKPADVERAVAGYGFVLENRVLCGRRHGCNELVFRKAAASR